MGLIQRFKFILLILILAIVAIIVFISISGSVLTSKFNLQNGRSSYNELYEKLGKGD